MVNCRPSYETEEETAGGRALGVSRIFICTNVQYNNVNWECGLSGGTQEIKCLDDNIRKTRIR